MIELWSESGTLHCQRDYKDLELTLENAKTVVRQKEAVREQQVTIKGDRLEAPQLLEAVGQKN